MAENDQQDTSGGEPDAKRTEEVRQARAHIARLNSEIDTTLPEDALTARLTELAEAITIDRGRTPQEVDALLREPFKPIAEDFGHQHELFMESDSEYRQMHEEDREQAFRQSDSTLQLILIGLSRYEVIPISLLPSPTRLRIVTAEFQDLPPPPLAIVRGYPSNESQRERLMKEQQATYYVVEGVGKNQFLRQCGPEQYQNQMDGYIEAYREKGYPEPMA